MDENLQDQTHTHSVRKCCVLLLVARRCGVGQRCNESSCGHVDRRVPWIPKKVGGGFGCVQIDSDAATNGELVQRCAAHDANSTESGAEME